jgi:hypothetical protein
MHQGDAPRQVDLTQLEGKPSPRGDPLFERQTHEVEFAGGRFRAQFRSDTPARSPAGTATAMMKLVLAASLPATGLAIGGWAMGAAGGLTLTLAVLVFVLVGGVGLFLILRIEQDPQAQGSGDRADLRRA